MSDRWQDMFQPHGGGSHPGVPSSDRSDGLEDEPGLIPAHYRPWVLQRVKSRPAMMMHLRRFEARSGLWMGWALSYPNLVAAEYTGDRMLSLDFGARQFMVQGVGLDQLIAPLQQGVVIALYEHTTSVWPGASAGPVISSIRRLGMTELGGRADC